MTDNDHEARIASLEAQVADLTKSLFNIAKAFYPIFAELQNLSEQASSVDALLLADLDEPVDP